ncbi:MAG: flavodoxin-dependent (E)-4-hydroxy-3-methylbut-2-enyl-diphosphate synthase [Clostridia bacterium]
MKKKEIKIGNAAIGGNNPVLVQSMTNTDTRDAKATAGQILELEKAGCGLVRIAVFNEECVRKIPEIKRMTGIPLAADIHFDHRLAVGSIEAGVDKIRINPGNIGGASKVGEVVKAASERQVPIRVGVNSGSLSKALYEKYGGPTVEAMMEDLDRQIGMIEDMGYSNLVIAAKSPDIRAMVEVNRLMHVKYDYPMHLGLTESGTAFSGTIKSSAALGILLSEGIGDTIRYSLTADPVMEVNAARVLLRALGISGKGVNIISCPTCGRTEIDIIGIAKELEERTSSLDINLDVAIMGCVVNGPNEARNADLGLAGGKGRAVIFEKGRVVKTVDGGEAVEELMKMILEKGRGD